MKKSFLKLLLALMLIGDMLYGALTKTEVSELYVALFNRASEGEGNSYWQTNQPDLIKTADVMLNTTDSKEYFGSSLDRNQAFIEHIYKNTLNKTIDDDPDGVKYWTDELDNGKSRAEVVIALINAIKTYKESTGKIKEAYDQFMNRVKVSNEMADKVYKAPSDYKTSTSFSDGLPVTFDISTITNAIESVDLLREEAIRNTTIVANAGEDQNVTFGENVSFDASGSKSSNGEIVSYTWKYDFYEYTTKEAKKIVSSSKLDIGTFEVTLKVTDKVGATATDTVIITIHK